MHYNLLQKGLTPADIKTLLMADYGLVLYGNAIMVNPDYAKANPKVVAGFVRATIKGVLDTVKDPEAAIKSVMKRNDTGDEKIELDRLKMSLRDNFVTPWVKANGFGGVDMARLAKSIDQIALTYDFENRPKPEDIFTSQYLPPAAERKRSCEPTASVDIGDVTLTYRGGVRRRARPAGHQRSTSRRGEFAAVVGPSGCGKSSLMKLVDRAVRPDSGEIVIFGDKVRGPVKIAGMAFQNAEPAPLAQGDRQRAAAARDRRAASPAFPPRQAGISRAGRARCSRRSGSTASASAFPGSCPAACSSGSRSAAH